MSKKEPYTIYSGIPTEVVANAEPLDYGNKSQLKALAIQHFKSKYDCTWEENPKEYPNNTISIQYEHQEDSPVEIVIDLSKPIDSDDFITMIDGNHWEMESISLTMLEDLISILRLYYIGDK